MKTSLFVLFLLSCCIQPILANAAWINPVSAPAFPPKWELLGSRKVNYGLDKDEIMVTRMEGRFTALKIKVRKGGINLHKVLVHFGDGQVQELEVREDIAAGGETRVIDLAGNRRVIQKVVFWYDTRNYANQKATVELWGRH